MHSVDQKNPAFHPNRAIVLAELTTKEKDYYYDLLLKNDVKFYYDAQLKSFVGNIRIMGPNRKRPLISTKKKVSSTNLPFEDRLKRLHEGGTISVRVEGAQPFDYNEFVRFVALIANDGEVIKPKQRFLPWIMRFIEEMYDARFSFEKNDIERDVDMGFASSALRSNAVQMFPVFVMQRMCTIMGLRSLVDQTCWDLLYNIHVYRHDYLEVELFARFLKEHFDYDDLLFFLYVRSVVSKTLNINFKARWTSKADAVGTAAAGSSFLSASKQQAGIIPPPLFLSYRECVRIAHIIYGSQGNEQICQRFIALVANQMVGELTATTDSRRIELAQFLHLAVISYHYVQNNVPMGGAAPAVVPAVSEGAKVNVIHMAHEEPLHAVDDGASRSVFDSLHDAHPGAGEDEGSAYASKDDGTSVRTGLHSYGSASARGYGASADRSATEEPLYYDAPRNTFEGFIEGLDAKAEEESVPVTAATPQEEEASERAPEEGKEDQSSVVTGAVSQWSHVSDVLANIQMDREREFLEQMCAPLAEMGEDMPQESAQSIVDELAEILRQKVNAALEGFEPASVEEFDNLLVEILQADAMVNEIADVRDAMIQYVLGEEIASTEEPQTAVAAETEAVVDVAEIPQETVSLPVMETEERKELPEETSLSEPVAEEPELANHTEEVEEASPSDDLERRVAAMLGTTVPETENIADPISAPKETEEEEKSNVEISGVPIGTGFSVWPVVAEEPRHELSEQFKGDEIAVEDMDDTSALTDNNTLVDHVIGKPEETAPIEDTGTIGNTEDNDTYAQIQTGREVEFLDYLCSPLSSLSEEAQVFIRNQLGETLREKMNTLLNGYAPANPVEYDETILQILQSESLLEEMEGACQLLVDEVCAGVPLE